MEPKLTVMMPVYNGRPYLEDAVRSVLGQTLQQLKLLIIDDGSDDGSGELLRRLAQEDARIELVQRGRRGQIATRNELLERATTDIVACADADDISLPDRLARQLRIFEDDPQLMVLGCQLDIIDASGRVVGLLARPCGAANVARALQRGTAVAQPSSLMRRKAILAMGGYREAYLDAEDYDCFLRASEAGKVDNADFVGVRYRVHAQSVSNQNAVRQMASADLAYATHRLRRFGKPDPTASLGRALDFDHAIMKSLLPAARIYKVLSRSPVNPTRACLRVLVAVPVGNRQAKAVQRLLLAELKKRPFDTLSAQMLYRAVALGPGRALRHYVPGITSLLPRPSRWRKKRMRLGRLIPRPL